MCVAEFHVLRFHSGERFSSKKFKDLQDTNAKLKNNASVFKNDQNKSYTSVQCLTIDKSKLDEILEVRVVGSKRHGIGYEPEPKNMPTKA